MCLSSAATIVNAGAAAILRAKSGAKRERYSEALGLYVHSAANQLSFAEQYNYPDGRFTFLWFSFNAAYSKDLGNTSIAESVLLEKQCIYQSFLNHHSRILSLANWQEHSKANKQATNVTLLSKYTAAVPSIIFCHLYTLRNQFTHDSTTWSNNSSRNQVTDAIAIFAILLSALIETIMNNKDTKLVLDSKQLRHRLTYTCFLINNYTQHTVKGTYV